MCDRPVDCWLGLQLVTFKLACVVTFFWIAKFLKAVEVHAGKDAKVNFISVK